MYVLSHDKFAESVTTLLTHLEETGGPSYHEEWFYDPSRLNTLRQSSAITAQVKHDVVCTLTCSGLMLVMASIVS